MFYTNFFGFGACRFCSKFSGYRILTTQQKLLFKITLNWKSHLMVRIVDNFENGLHILAQQVWLIFLGPTLLGFEQTNFASLSWLPDNCFSQKSANPDHREPRVSSLVTSFLFNWNKYCILFLIKYVEYVLDQLYWIW